MNMNELHALDLRLLDSSAIPLHGSALLPFAIDELECRLVGKGLKQPLIHIWRHNRAFILGLRDRRLPHASTGMHALHDLGYRVAVRNSGGAAVPLDEGVLNISLILPNRAGDVKLHDDFELLAKLIIETVRQLDGSVAVTVGEISGAYCPGAYDLSIGGRKFCGIAQRRQTGAFIVQAFIVVEGSGAMRARLVADFYQQAALNQEGGFPNVTESATASLQETTGRASIDAFVGEFKKVLYKERVLQQTDSNYEQYDQEELRQLIKLMDQRYNPATS